uniref:Uncharacterized protein LOC104246488 n=1 Tax=Nicotiana sylvestris TaxID=4096 RepID=A0A1U7Y907_NICSY|nr:PREDICTED: uncharacterized protein LOC104246488 [Nicotiana sylvestris]
MYNRYQSKTGVEDDQLGPLSGPYTPSEPSTELREISTMNRDQTGIDIIRIIETEEAVVGPREPPRLSEYNFNIDVVAIVSTIGCIKDTKWPRPLQSDPAQRDPNQMCKYHGTHGHRTEDCRQLRKEVAQLFNNGHLREFLSEQAKNHFKNRDSNKQTEQEEPQHVINMIIGEVDVPQGLMLKRTKVSITREKRTRDYIPEGTLSFNNEDAEGIVQPHNDALVISVLINKCRVSVC